LFKPPFTKLASRALAVGVMVTTLPALALEVGDRPAEVVSRRLDDPAASFALSATRGKVVYVDFWASWCVPCRLSMPALDDLYGRKGQRGFVVVGVNKDVAAGDARRFLDRVPVHFPLVSDADDAIARAFAVKAMPSGYLIDRKGTIRHVHRGFTPETAAALDREIEELLKEGS
jgi:peroxiredoxin